MIKQLALNEISKIVKHGDYTLKNGEKSNVYVDVKSIISFPTLFSYITELFCTQVKNHIKTNTDLSLCGVPYGGINLSCAIAVKMDLPQILVRKDKKEYGMKNQIEGNTFSGQNVILVEDVITTGDSVLEICNILRNYNINVISIFCVVLRNEQARKNIENEGYRLENLFSLDELSVKSKLKPSIENNYNSKVLTLRKRIISKNRRVVLAYDKNKDGLFDLLEKIHNNIIGLKIHSEILNLTDDEDKKLVKYCKEKNIFLWEDRKFNDIGETFRKQINYYEGRRDYISVIPTSGYHMLTVDTNMGFFVLCEMSSSSNLFNKSLTNSIISYMNENNDNNNNIVGIICQNENLFSLPFVSIKPGISYKKTGDHLGQKYTNIDDIKLPPDLIVVGRGITESINPEIDVLLYNKCVNTLEK